MINQDSNPTFITALLLALCITEADESLAKDSERIQKSRQESPENMKRKDFRPR